MDLRHLVTFITIVKMEGFKKAADELGYAQSSVTAHIKQMEEELGALLFDRLGKNIILTETGNNFLPYAKQIINLYEQSKELVHTSSEIPSGQLIIGASETTMIYWLPKIIKEYIKKYPDVHLVIKSLDYNHLFDQLYSGDIDVAVLVELDDWKIDNLTINRWYDEELLLVQPARTASRKSDETILLPEYTCSWRPLIEDYIKNIGSDALLPIALPSVEAIKRYVISGLGKTMLPRFTVDEELRKGQLVELEIVKGRKSLAIYTAVHKDKWISKNLEVFLELLEFRNDEQSYD